MSDWVLWLIAACVFGVAEMHFTTGFFLAPFALGALLAAIAVLAGAGGAAGAIVFLVASFLAVGIARPIAKRHMRTRPALRTGAQALIGKQAVVLERIANDEGVGCVRIDGEVWTARALDDDQVIERGTRVEVVDIKGATALVSE